MQALAEAKAPRPAAATVSRPAPAAKPAAAAAAGSDGAPVDDLDKFDEEARAQLLAVKVSLGLQNRISLSNE